MNYLKIFIYLQAGFTIVVASQGIFYLLGAAQAFNKMSFGAFLEQRQLLDAVISRRLKIFYLLTLLSGAIGAIACQNFLPAESLLALVVALLLVAADMAIALRVSIPLNKALIAAATDSSIRNAALQPRWVKAIVWRGLLSAIAVLALLMALFCLHR